MPKHGEQEMEHKLIADDSLAVRDKLFKGMQFVPGPDSDTYRSAAAKLLLTMIFTQKDTAAFIYHLSEDSVGMFSGYSKLLALKFSDSSVMNFYKDVIKLRSEFPTLVSGNYVLLDKDNPFTTGFERILGQDTLLVVTNMDNGVQAFSGNFHYAQLPVLLSNYDDGPLPPLESSLAMRPYEIKIYKIR